MELLRRVLVTAAVLVGVFLVVAVLGFFATRHSLFYLGLVASIGLPVSYWRAYRFAQAWWLFTFLALALAASPVDFNVRLDGGGPRVRLLPAHYGIACGGSDQACYGCSVPVHPVKRAIVFSY